MSSFIASSALLRSNQDIDLAVPEDAKTFYARCYSAIQSRVARSGIVERGGRNMDQLNGFLSDIKAEPRARWRRYYDLDSEAG
jgi:hypothetical protein